MSLIIQGYVDFVFLNFSPAGEAGWKILETCTFFLSSSESSGSLISQEGLAETVTDN